jgi:hypothetical protein
MLMTLPIWRKTCDFGAHDCFCKIESSFVLKTELESNQKLCTISLHFLKQPIIVLAADVWQLLFELLSTQGNGVLKSPSLNAIFTINIQ